MNKCEFECEIWAHTDFISSFLGNGHHVNCVHFEPNVGALDLLGGLVKGIEEWASNEDGVPDFLWESYKKAYFITKGSFPKGETDV